MVSFASCSTLQVDTICCAQARFADSVGVVEDVVVVDDVDVVDEDVVVGEVVVGEVVGVEDVTELGASPYPSPSPSPAAVRTTTPASKKRPRMFRDYGCEFKECHGYAEGHSEVP
jgi:hypothetical protein